MRRLVLALLLLAGITLPTFAAPAAVQAECPFFVVPPATKAAQSARELLVGTVEITRDGRKYDVVLHVEHVLRGPAQVGDVRSFKNLYPNWPRIKDGRDGTMGPCQPIPAYEGSVMVLALDALAPDGRTIYNAASWIRSGPKYNHRIVDTTLAEMWALAALPMTDTELVARPTARAVLSVPVLGVAFAAGFAAFLARVRRRASAGPRRPGDLARASRCARMRIGRAQSPVEAPGSARAAPRHAWLPCGHVASAHSASAIHVATGLRSRHERWRVAPARGDHCARPARNGQQAAA